MSEEPDPAARAEDFLGFSRWWQVVAAAAMMAVVSPYQYVWSSIEGPLAAALQIPLPALGLVFTLFVVFQSGSQFPVGWYRDRHGPRGLSVLAAILAGGGYVGLAYATSVWQLYLLYSLGAIGVGIVYTIAVNTALKWFPDRRGLTTGIGTMAFAGGSAALVPYVRSNANPAAYAHVLRNVGVLIFVVVLVGAFVLRDPPTRWLETRDGSAGEGDRDSDTDATSAADEASEADATSSADEASEADPVSTLEGVDDRSYTWREMIRTWQFWVMYGIFIAVSGAGLMLTAKIVSFAQELGLAAMIATLSATLLPVAGGVGRLVIGDLSDRLDRERAMAGSFLLCGLGLLGVVWFGLQGVALAFVGAVVVATFFWSPQYTLFPAVVGDYYGTKHSSANYALLYTGKMWGGVFGGGVASWLVIRTSWPIAFTIGGTLALLAGLAALVLRPPTQSSS